MRFWKLSSFLVLVLVGVFVMTSNVYSDETSEAILKLLIKKGIISQGEVNQIKSEIRRARPSVSRNLEQRLSKLEQKQKDTPQWLSNFKIKGDLRLRNEYIANDQGQDNNRQRLRFRLGATTKLNEQVKLGFGFATGSTDTPTSTNQTLENEFDSKNIWLDYAYAKYQPYEWLEFTGGKFKSPFFHTDMLWDSDIRFDGFAGKLTHKLGENGNYPTSLYLTNGYFPIDDANTSEGDDVYLVATQIGSETKFADGYAKLKTGLTYYNFRNVGGALISTFNEERGTNTLNTGGTAFAYDYRVLSPTMKVSFEDLFGIVDVPWGFLYEYAHNFDDAKEDNAWRTGFWLGKSKVKKKKDWKFLWQYSRLEADAFLDVFPDGDFNGAGTDAKGWEIIFDYGLTDNIILSLDYYNTESLSSDISDQQIVQADVIFKF
ncbi:MAG: putative porin [Omnitrophica bacterium]|nr:putative porin [Candidatus Omnitrophota bacterium]